MIKFRLSTAALRDGTLFLRAETLSPPKPRDAISAGQGRCSRRGWRGAFVPGLPLSRMLRLPPHADEKEADEEAPVLSPLLLPLPGPGAPEAAAGRAGTRGDPAAGAARPPRSRHRADTAPQSAAPPANQRAGGAAWRPSRGAGALPRGARPAEGGGGGAAPEGPRGRGRVSEPLPLIVISSFPS